LLSKLTSRHQQSQHSVMRPARSRTVRRLAGPLGVFFATALFASPSALAAEQSVPASANGYRSALGNFLRQTEAVRAGRAAPSTNGVPKQFSASGAPLECGGQGYIQSKYNGLYVSTEVGWTGPDKAMLRARATSVGPWELYQICGYSGEPRAIWSNGAVKFVSTELGYTGEEYAMLRARNNYIGPWEEYGFIGTTFFFSQANGRWVSAEFGYGGNHYGMLRARALGVGAWEEYNIT